jgi:hypothetical protein
MGLRRKADARDEGDGSARGAASACRMIGDLRRSLRAVSGVRSDSRWRLRNLTVDIDQEVYRCSTGH